MVRQGGEETPGALASSVEPCLNLLRTFLQAEQQLAALFDDCATLGRCILFLDELDALAGSRSREINEASRRMLSVLLRRLDGMDAQADTSYFLDTF